MHVLQKTLMMINLSVLRFSRKFANLRLLHQVQVKKNVQEVKIPVPWGHIAGKWWGRTDMKPLIGLHGWQDNAGTWDRLAPLLPEDISLLAIDSPGHGLSSHFPKGLQYYLSDNVFVLRLIVEHFGWDKISLLAHSAGAIQSFIYCSVYPEQVENFIAVDAFKPLSVDFSKEVKKLRLLIDKLLEQETLDPNIIPLYSYNEMIEKLYHGMVGKSLTKESCEVLLKRGMTELGGKYYFSRDARLKTLRLTGWPHKYILHMASKFNFNVLFIKANPGLVYETTEVNRETFEVIKNSAKAFEYHVVEGLHHVHLNNPERVGPIIVNFLQSGGKGPSDIKTDSLKKTRKDSFFNFL